MRVRPSASGDYGVVPGSQRQTVSLMASGETMMVEPATSSTGMWTHIRTGVVIIVALGLGVVLPTLRAIGLIDASWGAVLAPFTILGIIATLSGAAILLRQHVAAMSWIGGSHSRGSLTPAPDQLEPPYAAADAGERILLQHPELLAAVCHGFRVRSQQATVLGRPVADPWAVYAAAVDASSVEFRQVRVAARKHTQRFAASGKERSGRSHPDARLLRSAVQTFRRCAARTEAGRGDRDCSFEHVTVIFGIRSPERDAQLGSIAPRVRKLLEEEYPQLATARLADGSHVKYADWQEKAAQDRLELTRLRKAHERLSRRVEEAQAQLETTREEARALRTTLKTARQEAIEATHAEMQRPMRDLRLALDQARSDRVHDVQRLEAERKQLLATIEAMSTERETLERALFTGGDQDVDEDTREADGTVDLAGLRVLLVGGHEGHVPPTRQLLRAHDVQLVHEPGPGAVGRVAGVDVVVLWTRFIDHPTYYAIKRECRARNVPFRYWSRTSPTTLLTLLGRAKADVAGPDTDGEIG